MTNFGPIYVNCNGVLFTVAPHGSVLYKVSHLTKWEPAAISKESFELYLKCGDLRRR